MRKTVAVDLDGTLAQYDGWKGVDHIGDPIPGAVDFTKRLAEFADVLIYTCRCSQEVCRGEALHFLQRRVEDWLNKHGFAYHHVYTGQGKPVAAAYIDDRAIYCNPQVHSASFEYDIVADRAEAFCRDKK